MNVTMSRSAVDDNDFSCIVTTEDETGRNRRKENIKAVTVKQGPHRPSIFAHIIIIIMKLSLCALALFVAI